MVEVAVVGHDVGAVVRAPRLQVDVTDPLSDLGGGGDVLLGEVEALGGGFDPGGEQQRVGAVGVRCGVAGGVERGQDPLCAAAVSEDDPGPTEAVDQVEGAEGVVVDGPGQRGVDVGSLGPGEGEVLALRAAAHPVGRGSGGRREPGGVRGTRLIGQPGVGHRFERERPDAVEEPVPDLCCLRCVVVDDDQGPGGEPSDDVDRRGLRHVERREDGLDRGERGATGEGGERPQAPLVVREQQLVAPPDRGAQCPPAFGSPAGRDRPAPGTGHRAAG